MKDCNDWCKKYFEVGQFRKCEEINTSGLVNMLVYIKRMEWLIHNFFRTDSITVLSALWCRCRSPGQHRLEVVLHHSSTFIWSIKQAHAQVSCTPKKLSVWQKTFSKVHSMATVTPAGEISPVSEDQKNKPSREVRRQVLQVKIRRCHASIQILHSEVQILHCSLPIHHAIYHTIDVNCTLVLCVFLLLFLFFSFILTVPLFFPSNIIQNMSLHSALPFNTSTSTLSGSE